MSDNVLTIYRNLIWKMPFELTADGSPVDLSNGLEFYIVASDGTEIAFTVSNSRLVITDVQNGMGYLYLTQSETGALSWNNGDFYFLIDISTIPRRFVSGPVEVKNKHE